MNLSQYFIMFLIYSIFGWLVEEINFMIRWKKLVNRGFLIGPYCPIYGCGGVLITLFLSQYQSNPVTLFVMAMVICAVLEYITSYLLEKIFKARWWDYSMYKYNINGRICLEIMIPFGLLGCLAIYVINPLIFKLFALFTPHTLNIIAIVLVSLFFIDFIISLKIIKNLRKSASTFFTKDSTEEISRKVKETLENASKLINTRIVKAFPNLNKKINEISENVKKLAKALEDAEKKEKKKFLFFRRKKKD